MIPLMNVARQYKQLKKEIEPAVIEVLESGNYINGENVELFEEEFSDYIGTKFGIGVGNGTDALIIALQALGIGEGDEVITTALSFFATAESIAVTGAIPVFVDCTRDTYVIDAQQIEDKITPNTRAILPVHLYGQCADMKAICQIAQKHNLYVIEDVAQAAGASLDGKNAGTWGDISCFSFFPTKNLGAVGDGGMILTNDEFLARKCRALKTHGSGCDGLYMYSQKNNLLLDEAVEFGNNIPKYYNYVIGHNSRLDEIQAAILRVKLKSLDAWNAKRKKIANKYNIELSGRKGIQLPVVGDGRKHIFYVYIIVVENREALRNYLREEGIVTGVYFPVPLHLQKAFASLNYRQGDLPNAEYIAENSMAIPMFPELNDEEIQRVCDCIHQYYGEG